MWFPAGALCLLAVPCLGYRHVTGYGGVFSDFEEGYGMEYAVEAPGAQFN